MNRLTWSLCGLTLLSSLIALFGQMSLPTGTRLRVQMETPVDTKTSHVGDSVQALLVEAVQNGSSILVPAGSHLNGRVTAVSAENKKKQSHALLQLSFDELVLPDGHSVKTRASLQSLGMNEQVDADGVAMIHPFSHDFALKTGRKAWLRVNMPSSETIAAVLPANNPAVPVMENAKPRSHDNTRLSGKFGDLLVTLHQIENPAIRPRYSNDPDRHEVLITGTLKNVGKNPVCTLIRANLETSFRLDEPVTITLAGQDGGLVRELLPAEQIDAQFTSSVKNGTEPLKLKISQSESEQGCGNDLHHIWRNDVTIQLAELPRLDQEPPAGSADGNAKQSNVLQIDAGVSPPRLIRHVEPEFSKEARKSKHEGTVVVRATVGTDGLIHDPHVTKSLGWGLDEKALEAVSQWVFDPAIKDGRKVAVYVDIEVNFRLGK